MSEYVTDRTPAGPYVVWEDYGCEGWHPESYPTLLQAISAQKHSSFIITRVVKFDLVETFP